MQLSYRQAFILRVSRYVISWVERLSFDVSDYLHRMSRSPGTSRQTVRIDLSPTDMPRQILVCEISDFQIDFSARRQFGIVLTSFTDCL
jgi:hypothetical protein